MNTQAAKTLAAEATGPLKGVRILDLTGVVFGAYATQILGDLGADIIKVESPGGPRGEGGDVMRWAGVAPEGASDLGPIFVAINRNKRSILLDLKNEAQKQVLVDLIKTCDVFASTVRYDGMVRLGIDYESVKAIRPDILYVHGSGYGASGPRAGEPAYDDLIQAASGCADLLGRVDGDPRPRYLPTLIGDKVSGLFMAQAILAGLFHRQKTGEGQFVEVPMFESVTSFVLAEHMFGHVFEPPTGEWAYSRLANPNRRPFKTKDGFLGLMPYSVGHWRRFFKLANQPELIEDPRFNTQVGISANIRELYGILERTTVERTTEEWIEALASKGVPAVPVNRLEDLPTDKHLAAVGFFEKYEHPDAGTYYSMRSPMLFEKTPTNIRSHPPRMGEQTDELIAEARAMLGVKAG
jgi:crotonobetainyl-CoA:carnitine CoA-transferase CaiB-like acyl-CoA transferase